ncbi:hypothetical protein DM860_015638 [Cuscuta australis]|uniref:Uncharacterized protein n=1 Tax=Cuscuta australis TaxID=267555 RepID=A0A328DI20_9ASTE|nr:hypothetical protein DM860_015638 [Cuscuta australis]
MEPPVSSPRISFSADFLEEKDFISICPAAGSDEQNNDNEKGRRSNPTEFEFLSGEINNTMMITADQLFSEGKLLPFWQMHLPADKICRNAGGEEAPEKPRSDEDAVGLFLDDHDNPSPRLPKCTVLWKELLRLRKKNKASSSSSLSPSSSTSSSSSSGGGSMPDFLPEQGSRKKPPEKKTMKMEKGGNKSAPLRVRPVINVPICTPRKSTSSLSPLFNFPSRRDLWKGGFIN